MVSTQYLLTHLLTEYREAFALFDKKGTGQVPRESLGELVRSLGQNPTQAEVAELVGNVGATCEWLRTGEGLDDCVGVGASSYSSRDGQLRGLQQAETQTIAVVSGLGVLWEGGMFQLGAVVIYARSTRQEFVSPLAVVGQAGWRWEWLPHGRKLFKVNGTSRRIWPEWVFSQKCSSRLSDDKQRTVRAIIVEIVSL